MVTTRITPILLTGALAVLGVAPATASAGARDGFHATVLSVSPSGDSFRVSRSSATTLRIVVTASTKFERIAGVGALRRGMAIEVKASRVDGRWVAREVEISGGRGGEAEPGDDHGGHGEAEPGDDHGSGGHGSDDR
jgi:hypothetical protein